MLPLALGGLAVVAAAILAIALSQAGGSPAGSGGAGSSVSTVPPGAGAGGSLDAGEALPVYDSNVNPDPAVGRPVAEVSGTSFDGTPVSIRRDGTPKLLLFLAHWCPHCQNEVPKIQDWVDQNGMPEGVDFVSVATSNNSSRPNYPPDAWLAREGWTVPVLVDPDERIASLYGLSAFPYWVAVTGDGTVALRRTGPIPVEQLAGILDALRATAAPPAPSAAPSASGSPAGSPADSSQAAPASSVAPS